MNTDPVISPGVLKVLGVVLVAALIFGGIVLIPKIDLPEADSGLEEVTEISDTELSDTTIEAPEEPAEPAPDDPFSADSLSSALARVKGEVGGQARLTQLTINDVQIQFIVRKGDGVEARSVRSDTGELVTEEANVTISGNATIEDFSFPIAAVKPAAITRMLASARKQVGAGDFSPTVLSLERDFTFGGGQLEWTINAEGGGRSYVFRAKADGSDVKNQSGGGSEIPQAAQEARKLNECIADAGSDSNKVFECLEDYQ